MKNSNQPTIESRLLEDFNPQTVALAYHLSGRGSTYEVLKDTADEISIDFSDSEDFYKYGSSINSHLYIVADDETCDDLWDQDLDSFLEEIVLEQLPENLRFYFDEERWKREARMDGRAHSLGRFDGSENEEVVDGEIWYIYRQD